MLLAPSGVDLGQVLLIMWPASIVGLFLAALVMVRHGKNLEDDPEYQRRLAEHLVKPPTEDVTSKKCPSYRKTPDVQHLRAVDPIGTAA